MARKVIEVGIEGNDGTGDQIRDAFIKTNSNFEEIYSVFASGAQFVSSQDSPTGYVKFANGTVQMWGNSITNLLGEVTVLYPLDPSVTLTSIKSIIITPTTTGKIITTVSNVDLTKFTVYAWDFDANANASVSFYWFAIGFSL